MRHYGSCKNSRCNSDRRQQKLLLYSRFTGCQRNGALRCCNLSQKKKERQIIVVTHNANVVLGADAEEIIIANQAGSKSENKENRFEYRSGSIENDMAIYASDGRTIENGILNSQGIQQHICDILEGGERAFELRKNKYHI